jgi:hypothetical protein
MSEIKVNKISPRSGTTLTLGDSGDDFVIPAGATLTNNGTASGFASIAWQSTIVTGTTLSAVAGNGYWIDTTSNACTVTLPASASVGDQIILVDYDRTWATNNLTINRNGLYYQGGTENPVYDTSGQTVNIVYSGATNGWIPVSDDDVADEGSLPPYAADLLIIAGGGAGGGNNAAGGGGAGGFRYFTSQNLYVGSTYTVTVGAGGAFSASGAGTVAGGDSSISGTGISYTSAGGGGGGGNNGSRINGGSGGGDTSSSTYNVGTGGSGNTPSTSPSQGNDGGTAVGDNYSGAGGGGAGATGSNGGTGSGSPAGPGGAGTANSITGSSVTYAGGGGGSCFNGSIGSGGSGGGGDGGRESPNYVGQSGTANTGGGGGGSSQPGFESTPGGSGIVILRMLTSDYSGTTTGSPTVTTDGSYTVVKFTGSGSYTG